MNFLRFRRRFSLSFNPSGNRRRRRLARTDLSVPSLEALECRTLLAATISGVVTAGGSAFSEAVVSLYEADQDGATLIDQDTADALGQFEVSYRQADRGSFLYLVASDGAPQSSDVLLVGLAGEVNRHLPDTVTINELTTVGTVFALSQFLEGTEFFGPSPGFDNAVATAFTLFDGETGTAADVVSNFNNGTTLDENPRSTEALVKLNTLANMLAACATDATGDTLDTFFALATPAGGTAPTNTIAALQNISQNATTLDDDGLFALSQLDTTYAPVLTEVPDDWILALHFTDGGFNAPGRMAFDAEGTVWSNNNFLYLRGKYGPGMPPSLPGRQITVLDPAGKPILGSPIYRVGIRGSGYGTAIAPDGTIWFTNFDEGGVTKFLPNGRKVFFVPGRRSGLDHPMGMAFDKDGNLWIANMGNPADRNDPGSVTVYLKGNPRNRLTFTQDIFKPFSVAVDDQGRVWAANSPIPGGGGVVVMELEGRQVQHVETIGSAGLLEPIGDFPLRPFSEFASPRTIAIDSQGNAWIANFESDKVTFIDGTTFQATDYEVNELSRGWGLAVDGSDRVWVQSFSNPPVLNMLEEPPFISVVEGKEPGRGTLLATFSNPALEHVTALQLDASGNVWAANNWSLESKPGEITGGDGLVKFIGIATPVKTPLIGQPELPTADDSVSKKPHKLRNLGPIVKKATTLHKTVAKRSAHTDAHDHADSKHHHIQDAHTKTGRSRTRH